MPWLSEWVKALAAARTQPCSTRHFTRLRAQLPACTPARTAACTVACLRAHLHSSTHTCPPAPDARPRRWTGKKSSSVEGKKIDFITVGSRTSAYVPALQKLVAGTGLR